MKTKVLLLLLLFVSGCNQSNKPLSDIQKQPILKEAQTAVKEMFDALAVNDMNKFVEMLDSGPDMSFVFGDQSMNFNGMLDFVKQMSPTIEKQTFETIAEKYIILDAESFLYSWNGKNGMVMKTGETVMFNNFFASYIFKKVDGKWKFLYGHESPGIALTDSTVTKK